MFFHNKVTMVSKCRSIWVDYVFLLRPFLTDSNVTPTPKDRENEINEDSRLLCLDNRSFIQIKHGEYSIMKLFKSFKNINISVKIWVV